MDQGSDSDDEAFLEGDDAAFEAFVRRHQAFVFNLVRRFCRTPDDVRDVSQKVFLKVYENIRPAFFRRGMPPGFSMRAYLAQVALNAAKNHLRDEGRWRWASAEALEQVAAEGGTALQRLEANEQKKAVRKAVTQLPERQRDVFSLRIDGGLSFQDIAQALDIGEGNAKSHFHLAVKRLKEVLREAGDGHDV